MTKFESVTTPDGVRLAFRALGDGPGLLVIPNGMYLIDDFAWLAESRTAIFYDVRNRGFSDAVVDEASLARGIDNDVDDVEAVRQHFGAESIDLLAHSYVGTIVARDAAKYPARARRVVQIGPMPPDASRTYPPDLANHDAVLRETMARLGEIEQLRGTLEPVALCERFWEVLRPLYVVDPQLAPRIRWSRCEAPNERAFMSYWMRYLLPSLRATPVTAEMLAAVTAPVLIVHGRQDRSSPYGGALDWAAAFPDAELLTIENAAHAPWIEAPEPVFAAIRRFLR